MNYNIFSVILLCTTVMQAAFGVFGIDILFPFLNVHAIPLVIGYYLSSKKQNRNRVYLVALLLFFLGDVLISTNYKPYFHDTALIIFAVGLLTVSYIVLIDIQSLKLQNIYKVIVPFLILYLVPSIYFSLYKNFPFSIITHNMGFGFYIFVVIIKLVNEKNIAKNRCLFISAAAMFLMVLATGYIWLVQYNQYVNSILVIPMFSVSYFFMAKHMVAENGNTKKNDWVEV